MYILGLGASKSKMPRSLHVSSSTAAIAGALDAATNSAAAEDVQTIGIRLDDQYNGKNVSGSSSSVTAAKMPATDFGKPMLASVHTEILRVAVDPIRIVDLLFKSALAKATAMS